MRRAALCIPELALFAVARRLNVSKFQAWNADTLWLQFWIFILSLARATKLLLFFLIYEISPPSTQYNLAATVHSRPPPRQSKNETKTIFKYIESENEWTGEECEEKNKVLTLEFQQVFKKLHMKRQYKQQCPRTMSTDKDNSLKICCRWQTESTVVEASRQSRSCKQLPYYVG